MLPHAHAAATLALAVPLRRRGWSILDLLGLFAGSVLVDGDHYLSYVWHTGDLSARRAYQFHRSAYRSPFSGRLYPRWPTMGIQRYRELHSFPAILVILAASMLAGRAGPFLRAVGVGLIFHRALDEVTGWVYPPPRAKTGDPDRSDEIPRDGDVDA